MTNRTHRRFRELPLGTRILTGRARTYIGLPHQTLTGEELRIERIVESDREGIVLERPDGTRRSHPYQPHTENQLRYAGGPSVIWTDELPTGPDAAVLAYAEALLVAKTNCGLFHLRSVDGGVATAALVRPRGYVEDEARERKPLVEQPQELIPVTDAPEEDRWEGHSAGNAAFWKTEVKVRIPEGMELKAGDLIATTDYHCEIVADAPLVVPNKGFAHLGNHDEAGVGAFLPWCAVSKPEFDAVVSQGWGSVPGMWTVTPGSLVDFVEQEELARVRLEPSEALFIWYRPIEGQEGETACACLGSSGIAFHRVDSIADNFYGHNVEEGLWVYEKAKAWAYQSYEGEWDAGIDGDWRPATVDDLARFGYSTEDMDREIPEYTEEDFVEGRALAMMVSAEEACAREKAEASPAP